MVGDVQTSKGDPRVLVEETRRVLDAQQQVIHRQRRHATNAIRIVLTACGLLLTLVSLGLTSHPVRSDSSVFSALGTHSAGIDRAIVLGLVAAVSLLGCRMLCAALVVLEPRTAAHPLAEVLTAPVLSSDRPTTDGETSGPMPFDGPVAFRAGIDADAATDFSTSMDPAPAVLAYNAGCVAGNAAIARRNRWYLARVYRSAVLAVVLVTSAVLVAIVLHAI